MASILDLYPNHPAVQEAVGNARALVTARMAITAVTPDERSIYDRLLAEMVTDAIEAPDMLLYAAQLAALVALAAGAIKVTAGAKGAPVDDVRAVLYRILDETGGIL